MRLRIGLLLAAVLAVVAGAPPAVAEGDPGATTTPIKHLVVIFQENVSFDHYFATYPIAANPPGEPRFVARPGTPTVNGLSAGLLTRNPNSSNPFRLDRSQAHTCDMGHDYTQEQLAFDHGLMDRFPETTGNGTGCANSQVMGYYDGNTVTAFWNYAQSFAMSDNSYSTGFGPSTVGALNLVAGNTYGAACTSTEVYCGGGAVGTVTGDPQPTGDKCDT
ncbi:MAG TPA: alkaline phosphatase family protein, partial [Candidatus Dormibacteraeota bacterium]